MAPAFTMSGLSPPRKQCHFLGTLTFKGDPLTSSLLFSPLTQRKTPCYINLVNIAIIRKALVENKFRYTKHGTEQRINRHITGEEIEQAILTGEIIENYPS
ncbi:MAG: hypothetical protein BROFUL_01559, partial [Candidatus Brocadia fulgida]